MSSGIDVDEEVVTVFTAMKVHKAQENEEQKMKRKKAVFFRVSDDKEKIIRDLEHEILQGDVGTTISDPYSHFVSMLPEKDCRYALYDASYETSDHSKKEDLVFILWAPDDCPTKIKMLYASSKDAIKKKFTGIKHEWQVNSMDDIKDRRSLADKLGGSSVIGLEGSPV